MRTGRTSMCSRRIPKFFLSPETQAKGCLICRKGASASLSSAVSLPIRAPHNTSVTRRQHHIPHTHTHTHTPQTVQGGAAEPRRSRAGQETAELGNCLGDARRKMLSFQHGTVPDAAGHLGSPEQKHLTMDGWEMGDERELLLEEVGSSDGWRRRSFQQKNL